MIAITTLSGDGQESTTPAANSTASALSQTNEVTIKGVAIPEFKEPETAQGAAAPQVTGSTFDGESMTLLESGTPTVIGFFAHWCPACQNEVDKLSKHLTATGLPDDVNVVAVSTAVDSDRSNFPPSAWFESEGWPAPVLTDNAQSSAAMSYGLSGFPFWAIVDADGNLVSRTAGGVSTDEFDAFINVARAGA